MVLLRPDYATLPIVCAALSRVQELLLDFVVRGKKTVDGVFAAVRGLKLLLGLCRQPVGWQRGVSSDN